MTSEEMPWCGRCHLLVRSCTVQPFAKEVRLDFRSRVREFLIRSGEGPGCSLVKSLCTRADLSFPQRVHFVERLGRFASRARSSASADFWQLPQMVVVRFLPIEVSVWTLKSFLLAQR